MSASQPTSQDIDDYISGFPDDVQEKLQKLRLTIREAAPNAKEAISYKMPAFLQDGFLVSFAAHKKHIGLYPAASGDDDFNARLSPYLTEKSTVRLPLDKPIPYDLITELVKLRVRDNLAKAEAKSK